MSIKAFHIDTGRKYFSYEQIIDLIDVLSENNYNMIELAFGNGGFRLLLDDMTVTTAYRTYESDVVKSAIHTGNVAFCDNGTNELTESEARNIITYAGQRNIMVMPLLNTPGHMDALITAMKELTIKNAAFKNSVSTVDLENSEAVAFTTALLSKYINWFADNNCAYINLGSDEYANDVLASGFAALKREHKYNLFIDYVNNIASIIKRAGATPVMFNDGVYYDKDLSAGMLDKNIIVSYWCPGWDSYALAPAAFVESQGHKILDTNSNWYYVLGRRLNLNPYASFTIESALENVAKSESAIAHQLKNEPIGRMFCLWCDEPNMPYDDAERAHLHKLLQLFK